MVLNTCIKKTNLVYIFWFLYINVQEQFHIKQIVRKAGITFSQNIWDKFFFFMKYLGQVGQIRDH